jgi:shikimate kinase/3-dehydroquinate synthase
VNRVPLPAPPLPPGRPNLVITGFMGTGKSTVGRLAARGLGIPFVDLDALIEAREGRSAAAIIDGQGEAAFRALERELVARAARLSGTVIATGGGAPVDRESFAALTEGAEVAVLSAAPDELARRLDGGGNRPLLRPDPAGRTEHLLRERAEAYAAAGAAVDTTGRRPEAVAGDLVERYRRLHPAGAPTRIDVAGPDGTSPVVLGPGLLAEVGPLVAATVPGARTAALVADPGASPLADGVAASLERAGLGAVRPAVPRGEEAKTVSVVGALWDSFRHGGLEPTDVVVAVGGGAVLDAAGFAAATYARGVALVHVPTTLLAMVDASIGGKAAIDHAGVKNLVGALHHPRLVVLDPEALAALPEPTLATGLSEVVKAGVLASPLLLDLLPEAVPGHIEWILEQAVRIKAAYVSADRADRGLRRSLNLGHTFAHAIEAASGYAVSHGEAVAVGLVAAARLGARLGITERGLEPRLSDLLTSLGLPVEPPQGLDRQVLLAAMGADKKRRSGRAAFVVPAPDGAELVEGLEPEEAVAGLLERDAAR